MPGVTPLRALATAIAMRRPEAPSLANALFAWCVVGFILAPLAIIVPTTFRSYFTHRAKGIGLDDVVRQWTLPATAGVATGAAVAAVAPAAVFKVAFAVIAGIIAAKLLFGRESAGVPEAVHNAADARLCIPIRAGLRSLNIAVAVAMVASEALRQTGGFARPV